jgi:cation:H+ antiporter
VYYLTSSILTERRQDLVEEYSKEYTEQNQISLVKAFGMVILGLVGVVFGGKLVVDNASDLARLFGISEILIGLTIVAIGTSLPEIATSLVAALKKESDIAVGNIVGSNIFNTFFILGINATISPVPFGDQWFIDTFVMIIFAALLFITSLTGKTIKRSEGLALLIGYIFYSAFIIGRG